MKNNKNLKSKKYTFLYDYKKKSFNNKWRYY